MTSSWKLAGSPERRACRSRAAGEPRRGARTERARLWEFEGYMAGCALRCRSTRTPAFGNLNWRVIVMRFAHAGSRCHPPRGGTSPPRHASRFRTYAWTGWDLPLTCIGSSAVTSAAGGR